MSKYPIVVPGLDPNERLVAYCRELRAKTDQLIVLVDDGSDETHRKVFERCLKTVGNVVLLKHEVNRGKGRALKTAFDWLLRYHPGMAGCVTVDSDGQHLVPDVIRCVEAGGKSPDALVLGCRVFTGEHVPWKSRFGNNWMKFLFLAVTGRKFMDTQTGLRVIPKAFMERLLKFPGDRFEFETEMLLGMGRMPLVQVPIETVYEEGNKSTHFRPLVDSCKVLRVILKSLLRRMGLFIVSSLTSFAIDVSLFYVLYEFLLSQDARGRLWWAMAIARVVSMTYNYLVNKLVVFRVEVSGLKSECGLIGQYLLTAAVVLGGAYLLTKALCACFPASPVVAWKVLADSLMFLLSYGVQRVYIFKQ